MMVPVPRPPPQHMVTSAVAAVGALELVQRLGDEDGAGAAERVAEGDGAAVGVDLGQVGAELARPGQHHRGEGLVDLDQVDVGHRQAGALEQVLRWRRSGR